jgi:hypothetical protein
MELVPLSASATMAWLMNARRQPIPAQREFAVGCRMRNVAC